MARLIIILMSIGFISYKVTTVYGDNILKKIGKMKQYFYDEGDQDLNE